MQRKNNDLNHSKSRKPKSFLNFLFYTFSHFSNILQHCSMLVFCCRPSPSHSLSRSLLLLLVRLGCLSTNILFFSLYSSFISSELQK